MDRRPEKKQRRKRITAGLLILFMLLFMCACGGQDAKAETTSDVTHFSWGSKSKTTDENSKEDKDSSASGKKGGYVIPEFKEAVFHPDKAEGNEEVLLDLSAISQGYVAMNYVPTDVKIKFQVLKDDLKFTYSVVTGKDQIFPLQAGNGTYIFRVMKNVEDNKYAEIYHAEANVTLDSEFDPFLRTNQYTEYTKNSECVKKAAEFAKSASDEEDFINEVYSYIVKNVKYDTPKAESVQSGYLPDPDDTYKTNKGICLDYSSLAAAMLRSQGIPTKIIFGYVAPDDVYHAWNMFYTEKDGWKLAKFTVSGKNWNRVDTTFAAGNASAKFIGDGSNYMDAYTY